MALACLSVFGLVRLGLTSSKNEIDKLNQELFASYRDEVTRPEYRGLKLFGGKKAYQIDNKEFTSSNLDDLKALVLKQ